MTNKIINIIGGGRVGIINAIGLLTLNAGTYVHITEINEKRIGNINKLEFLKEDISFSFTNKKVLRSKLSCSKEMINNAFLYLICLGTPFSHSQRELDNRGIKSVIKALLMNNKRNIVIRSTVSLNMLNILEKENICLFPEFTREGNGLNDFLDPPFLVISSNNTKINNRLLSLQWSTTSKNLIFLTLKETILIKLLNNCYHALKISFFNEIGRLCYAYNSIAYDIIDMMMQDKNINLTSAYTRPGLPFGGPCLGKDLRGIQSLAEKKKLKLSVINAISQSNCIHLERIVCSIKKIVKISKLKNICFVGVSFKEGTNDLRNSVPYKIILSIIQSYKNKKYYFYDQSITTNFMIDNLTLKYISKSKIMDCDVVIFLHNYKKFKSGSCYFPKQNICEYLFSSEK